MFCFRLSKPLNQIFRAGAALALTTALGFAQGPALPNAPGRDTVQRVCGACHSATVVVGRGMTEEGWGEVVASMISRGAKGTPADFQTVTAYLAKNFPPNSSAAQPAAGQARVRRRFPAGPSDQQVVDPQAANRGKILFGSDCASCHGPMARGSANAPDLVRSDVVLHDRYGNDIGPYLRDKHPPVQTVRLAGLTEDQIKDLANFLHQQVGNTLRSGPYTKVLNVLTGDAPAGEAYFNGAGGCAKCHSPTGDLAGIASRYDAPTLQQRMLFPRTVVFGRGAMSATKPVMITVTLPNGESVSGTLVRIDDFDVAMRDGSGTYHSWKRTPDLKIELKDPYAAHNELLNTITDTDIHNLVAYLDTLK